MRWKSTSRGKGGSDGNPREQQEVTMTDWLLIALLFGCCWVANRWAFRKDVERGVRWAMQQRENS